MFIHFPAVHSQETKIPCRMEGDFESGRIYSCTNLMMRDFSERLLVFVKGAVLILFQIKFTRALSSSSH